MSRKTVLVVDPNPGTRRRVEEAFRGTGFPTLFASGASEAEAAFREHQVDLVLSAVRLPEGNGYDLAREVRDEHPAALVYLMAGGFDVYDATRARDSGVDGKISVPFTPRSLRETVEAAIGPVALSIGPTEIGEAELSVVEEEDEAPSYEGPIDEAVEAAVPVSPPPVSEERLASFLPRDYRQARPVSVDPAVVGPAVERAIMEVLPEVVEAVMRNALTSSPAFRRLVEEAVERAVAERLDGIARDD